MRGAGRVAPFVLLLMVLPGCEMKQEVRDVHLELREGWTIQSSARVESGGEGLSQPGFDTTGWHGATVPTTVVRALVDWYLEDPARVPSGPTADPAVRVVDFVSGMTDRYALRAYEDALMPRSVRA